MPIHDWTRVDAGLFHHFHQQWNGALCNALNTGVLPNEYFALVEQHIRGPIADVLTLQLENDKGDSGGSPVGLSVITHPPQTKVVRRSEADLYASKANRIAVRHRHGEIVAVIEIVSPGNKGSRHELRSFVNKAVELIEQGIHLLIIDLFPPSQRDPQGIHKLIWDEFMEDDFSLPSDKPLTLAAYDATPPRTAYVEPVTVGDSLRDMPLFLRSEIYVPAPLEQTYAATWELFPTALKNLLQ